MAEEMSQAEMDKYFESGGKIEPAALIEATKADAILEPEAPEPEIKAEPEVKEPEVKEPPEGQVQVNTGGKMVPLAELLEERKNRQSWEQTAAQQQQQLTETLKMLQERAKAIPQTAEDHAPDPNADPFGYRDWVINKLAGGLQDVQAWRQQQEQVTQQNQRLQQAAAWTQNQEAEYTKMQPKYPDAFKFAVEARTKEFAALGLNPAQIQQALQADNQQVFNLAIQQGKNPAQLIWDYAQAKGYIIAEQKKVPDLDDKVKTLERGQRAAKSLSGTGGSAPTEINNLQDLTGASEDMSDEEFSKAFDKLIPRMKGKVVG